MSASASRSWHQRLGSGWMVVAALLFTLMNIAVKDAHLRFHFGTGELVFWRMLFCAAVLAVWALGRRKRFATPYIRAHLSRSISGTLGMLFIFYGIMHLTLATGTMLSYTSSIFLALLSRVVLKERIERRTGILLCWGFAGVVLLLNPSFGSGQEWAALVGLAGGFCAGWAYMQVRELSQLGEPAWRVVFYLSLVGSLIAAVWATASGWHPLPSEAWPHLLVIGASALAAQLAMTYAYQVGRKFTVASLAYLTVVFSTLSGMLLFGEGISTQEWLGMAVIISSGILSLKRSAA